jgi:hypothetical protein
MLLAVGVVVLLAEQGSVITETIDAQLAPAPVWLAFIAFLVWLILRLDPFRSVRRTEPMGCFAVPAGLIRRASQNARL